MAEDTSSNSTFGFLGRGYTLTIVTPAKVEVSEKLRSGPFHVALITVGPDGVIEDVEWGVPFNADSHTEWRATMLTLVKSHGVLTLQEAIRRVHH